MTVVQIDRLDRFAQGVASGSAIAVRGALPGDTITDGVSDEASPHRATPPCRHFGSCGGCLAQHMSPALYQQWKHDLVSRAFRDQGLSPTIDTLVSVPPRTRRRARFSVTSKEFGFHAPADTKVIDLVECPVVTARIEAALPKLRAIVAAIGAPGEDTRVSVADLDGGLDVVVSDIKTELTAKRLTALANLAASAGLARLTVGRDTIVTRTAPRLVTSAGAVPLSPDGFFQAVADAEQAIVTAVIAGLPVKIKRIADLFAGTGTLTLPLARVARVLAADSEKVALESLVQATRHTQGLKPIETLRRDLFREPLSVKELEPFDAVVLDPPYAGAKAQCEQLAMSKVKTVVLVSCHPGTLARDAKILIGGGFTLGRVTPIDQFLWSNHVECVAVLRR